MRCDSLPGPIWTGTNVSDVKRTGQRIEIIGPDQPFIGLCVCVLLASLLIKPMLVEGDQSSVRTAQPSADQSTIPTSLPSSKPQKELSQAQPPSQESKPAPQRNPNSKSEESKSKGDKKAEEGIEKEKDGGGKRTVSSLILTVKLALLADPRLFPYDIEVETGSDEVVLLGKVSSMAEKSIAAEIAGTVPGVKAVANKIEIVKELPEVLAQRQDDIVTRQVKERFAQSATLKAAGFEVKTEKGVVSLGGAVRFQVFVLEAAEAARHVPGVKAVKTDKVRIESEG